MASPPDQRTGRRPAHFFILDFCRRSSVFEALYKVIGSLDGGEKISAVFTQRRQKKSPVRRIGFPHGVYGSLDKASPLTFSACRKALASLLLDGSRWRESRTPTFRRRFGYWR
jgi:hypothetical protein